MEKIGVLLVNIGTPDAPEPQAVGRYLREFLMDPFVIDIPAPLRWFFVNALIVPKRKFSSAEQYKTIWTEEGSPLMVHAQKLASAVQEKLSDDYLIEPAMRYQSPSIESVILKMQAAQVKKLVIFPLYPQYSLAATESTRVEVQRALKKHRLDMEWSFIEDYYDSKFYIDAFVDVAKETLKDRDYDFVLFSSHGIPERHIRKLNHPPCLESDSCCESQISCEKNCYRAQCYHSSHAIAKKLGLEKDKYAVAFQSRLGRTPWIKPYSDHYYESLPKQGVKKLAVICPSFTADCLETVEEVSIRGKESFVESGGEDLFLVPSLNSSEPWVNSVSSMISEFTAQ